MSINEFDRLLNEKFDRHEFPYNRAGWERLEQQLPKNRDRKTIPLFWWKATGIAAALALTISGVAWYYQSEHSGKTLAVHHSSENRQQTTSDPVPATSPLTPAEERNMPPVTHYNPTVSSSKFVASSQNAEKRTFVQEKAVSTTTPIEKPVQSDAASPSQPIANESQKPDFIAPEKKQVNTAAFTFNNEEAYEPVQNMSRKTILSLTGGMNYGSMNAGYMAGINARQKLGKKLFVEGDLALVNNTASQSFTQQQQQFATANKAPIEYNEAQLLYIQFNPTVGYQVMKNVSLGVGADVQRLMNGDNSLVNVNDEIKTIPGTDVGLTGKTEISLSPRLKAGLLYREGINNFLSNSGDYLDRRYFQVQLKFAVIGK